MSDVNMVQTLLHTGRMLEKIENENKELRDTLKAISDVALAEEVLDGLENGRYILKDESMNVALTEMQASALANFARMVRKVLNG